VKMYPIGWFSEMTRLFEDPERLGHWRDCDLPFLPTEVCVQIGEHIAYNARLVHFPPPNTPFGVEMFVLPSDVVALAYDNERRSLFAALTNDDVWERTAGKWTVFNEKAGPHRKIDAEDITTLAVDSDGDLWLSARGIMLARVQFEDDQVFTTGLLGDRQTCIVLDKLSTVYLANAAQVQVRRATAQTYFTVLCEVSGVRAMAVSPAGILHICDGNTIRPVTEDGCVRRPLSLSLKYGEKPDLVMAFDPLGNLYAYVGVGRGIVRWSPDGHREEMPKLASDYFGLPTAMVISETGIVFVAFCKHLVAWHPGA